MKEVIRKELKSLLRSVVDILSVKERKDFEELKELSFKGIESVAAYKDFDLISLTVLIYSTYKIYNGVKDDDYKDLLAEYQFALSHIESGNLGRYNKSIKLLYNIVSKFDASVKDHLDDVMHAAKIKQSSILLSKGLSMGQAAGLMGLSNWDLQQYAGSNVTKDLGHEKNPVDERYSLAKVIFGVE